MRASHTPLPLALLALCSLAVAPAACGDDAARVLKPGGILSITLYQHTVIEPALDVILRRFHDEVVGSHWPPRTKWSRTYYRAIPFPFDELESPGDLAATAVWTYPDLLGYIESWSATR